MVSRNSLAYVVLSGVVCAASVGYAADVATQATRPALTVDEIVERANRAAYYQGRDGRAQVSMTIVDAQGRKQHRRFTILRWDQPAPQPAPKSTTTAPSDKDDRYCGDQKFYVYFHLPADVNKMVFMVWKHLDKDDDRWMYLPALDLKKRISSAEKRTSFVGSHFFYEDVSGRHIKDDRHELLETTPNYYKLKSVPKDPKSVEFSYSIAWIHKKTFLPSIVEYFDKQGQKYREYKAEKVEWIQGFPTVTKSHMKDLKRKGETTLEYSGVKYNVGIPESVFTERYLRLAPRKYLK